MKISMIFSSLHNYFRFFHPERQNIANGQHNLGGFVMAIGQQAIGQQAIIWRLFRGYLTIRWSIGRILIGNKHILSGCTGHPDKRDKGTFGAG